MVMVSLLRQCTSVLKNAGDNGVCHQLILREAHCRWFAFRCAWELPWQQSVSLFRQTDIFCQQVQLLALYADLYQPEIRCRRITRLQLLRSFSPRAGLPSRIIGYAITTISTRHRCCYFFDEWTEGRARSSVVSIHLPVKAPAAIRCLLVFTRRYRSPQQAMPGNLTTSKRFP